MTPRDPYSEQAWLHSRRSRSGLRHDDGPIPDEWATRVRADRERMSRHLAWIAIGFVVLAFAGAWL